MLMFCLSIFLDNNNDLSTFFIDFWIYPPFLLCRNGDKFGEYHTQNGCHKHSCNRPEFPESCSSRELMTTQKFYRLVRKDNQPGAKIKKAAHCKTGSFNFKQTEINVHLQYTRFYVFQQRGR